MFLKKDITTLENLRVKPNRSVLEGFCQKNHIRFLSFFGSVLRNDFNADSDVDVLVEFEKGHTPSYFELLDMEEELSEILGNRKVDLQTQNDLSRFFNR